MKRERERGKKHIPFGSSSIVHCKERFADDTLLTDDCVDLTVDALLTDEVASAEKIKIKNETSTTYGDTSFAFEALGYRMSPLVPSLTLTPSLTPSLLQYPSLLSPPLSTWCRRHLNRRLRL